MPLLIQDANNKSHQHSRNQQPPLPPLLPPKPPQQKQQHYNTPTDLTMKHQTRRTTRLRGLVCDCICLDHLRPRLNISHCYPPMDSGEGTMCLMAAIWTVREGEACPEENEYERIPVNQATSVHWT